MTHEVVRHLLDDYVAGDLTEDARVPVLDHIGVCAICRSEVDGLEKLAVQAAALPRAVEPPVQAWAEIRSVIERDARVERTVSRRSSSRFRAQPYALAAAGLLVALVSSGGTALYLRERAAPSVAVAPPAAATADPAGAATLAAFTIEENNYLREAATLADVLEKQQGVLAPETVAQLKKSLRIIDDAILEARNALARDPGNRTLVEMLSANYRHKVDLLRRTTEMTRSS